MHPCRYVLNGIILAVSSDKTDDRLTFIFDEVNTVLKGSLVISVIGRFQEFSKEEIDAFVGKYASAQRKGKSFLERFHGFVGIGQEKNVRIALGLFPVLQCRPIVE